MRRISLIVAGFLLTLGGAAAEPPAQVGPSTPSLSFEQEIKVGEIITDADPSPLVNVNFQFSVGGVVPRGVDLHPVPSAAVDVAPNLRGFGYIVVEELIGIVDQNNLKVVAIFQRWRPQQTTGQGR